MNQKCLTTIFVPVQPMNFNNNPPLNCKKHQKPLSYYNKFKPDNDPICLDCLLNEIKEGNDSNLYLPISNLEQEYYYQKNAFFQVIEQANSMKKYEVHITNFQSLLTNYFSQFISKFVKEKIYVNSSNSGSPKKKVDFYEKSKASLSSKDIMNILNKVENEKFILENKSADVFCQLNKLQQILLKNHEGLAKSFKDLLYGFFQDSKNNALPEAESSKENSSLKAQSIKKSDSNNSVPSNSSKKSGDNFTSTKFETKIPNDDNLSQFSPIEDLKVEFNDKMKEISNFATKINLNMEKEKIFDKNIDFEPEEESKIMDLNNSFSNKNNSEKPKDEHELEWRKKKSDQEEMSWRKKPEDEDNWREHKDKINQLIERDKNKKSSNVNQSFFKPRKSNYKKRNNLNKSFQKFNPIKFNFSKKIEYKQYNQFLQKACSKCGSSFVTTKDDEVCQNCKYISEDEGRLMKRGNDFFNKKKFGFFQKNLGPKKHHVPPHLGNKKFFGKKNDTTFTRNFGNKSLIHSRTNFINPKGFNMNSKYKNNKAKENFNDNNKKNNFGGKKYSQKKKSEDDFEVDFESDEENISNNEKVNGKTLFKKTCDFYSSSKKNEKNKESDSDFENKINSDDSKSKNSFDRKEPSEKEKRFDIINADNGENNEECDGENENNDFECDF